MNNAFETWLNELTYTFTGSTYITNRQYLQERDICLDSLNKRVKDDFLLYRYCMKDEGFVKDCFYMQFKCVSPACKGGAIRYESVLKEDAKTHIGIWENVLDEVTGPDIIPHHGYVYRYEEDDELVIQYYIRQEQIRKEKALEELNRANARLEYLHAFGPVQEA